MKKAYLVGAGPGDPGLLTLKGRAVLEQADCVLYDNLANPALLALVKPGAECIYVGKKKSHHPKSQEEICSLLVERARQGLCVVRLKGGDPYLFGRGGEEAEALAQAGVPFEVVPGVTSPSGLSAYAGVPLTHREHTSAVTFVTGHAVEAIDWAKVGHAETLVVLMGLTNIRQIAARLISHGKNPKTPAMAVRWASRPFQQTIVGVLEDIADRTEAAQMKPPATFVIGEVVKLRDQLNWYERLPLFGQRIVVTRARNQATQLSEKLALYGAEVVEFPVIEIAPPDDPSPLDTAIQRLSQYDWLIFTSVNGVQYFLDRLDRSNLDLRQIKGKICAIGPATRRALEQLHLKVDLMPEQYVAESLVEAFQGQQLAGKRVLLPRAKVARDVVPVALRQQGAEVDVVEAYQTVLPTVDPKTINEIFERKPDWITFTSSSTVKNFLSLVESERFKSVRLASIGPVTSETARQLGLRITVEAAEHTMDGLVEAILKFVS
ncbi:MAG: uroporphyrinogen-III C-methyltransferase [Bryobacteraceae bacterium]|nr:uroporphyrinogen-III C-methyltransferase [Bryobacteraceae bacterium]MDW8378693.1 uroporphyrinogen-III C-methyltransferase [Bryobacterales bacterium]